MIAAPEGETPRQLESGDEDEEAGAAPGATEGSDGVADSDGAATPPAPEEPVVQEATLIEEFDKLEQGD